MHKFLTVGYLPLLSVRPAELRALKELPEKSKDRLLPFCTLRPWTTAHHLDSVLVKIEESFGNRPIIIDAGVSDPFETGSRPVHIALNALRNPANGYRNWYEFLKSRSNYIPSLQISDPNEIIKEIGLLASLERGLVVRVPDQAFGSASDIASAVQNYIDPIDVCIILDYEQASKHILTRIATCVGIAKGIFSIAPNFSVAVSASSFPMDFTSCTEQEIYERQFFNGVRESLPNNKLIYSDRGSARAERQNGGGGAPAPRIDLAGTSKWGFFREEDDGDRDQAYFDAAVKAIKSPLWDKDLHVWGTQMIERTAAGDDSAIVSPARSTAARINIHLQQQLYYDKPDDKYDTDEDWEDL